MDARGTKAGMAEGRTSIHWGETVIHWVETAIHWVKLLFIGLNRSSNLSQTLHIVA